MRYRFSIGFIVLVFINIVSLTASSWAKPSRLETFAAKQRLRDMVCVAMADGWINPHERAEILSDAKQILTPEEFQVFNRELNRISPPQKKRVAKRRAYQPRQTAAKPPALKHPQASAKPQPMKQPVAKTAKKGTWTSDLIIPVTAILPDRMVNFIRSL